MGIEESVEKQDVEEDPLAQVKSLRAARRKKYAHLLFYESGQHVHITQQYFSPESLSAMAQKTQAEIPDISSQEEALRLAMERYPERVYIQRSEPRPMPLPQSRAIGLARQNGYDERMHPGRGN